MNDEQLTEIYNKANGIEAGKNPPITTERIFAAMREAVKQEREACAAICDHYEEQATYMASIDIRERNENKSGDRL